MILIVIDNPPTFTLHGGAKMFYYIGLLIEGFYQESHPDHPTFYIAGALVMISVLLYVLNRRRVNDIDWLGLMAFLFAITAFFLGDLLVLVLGLYLFGIAGWGLVAFYVLRFLFYWIKVYYDLIRKNR